MTKHSYRNPFSGVNAVQMNEDKILEYWCSPFRYDLFSGITEEDIYSDNNNIVLMGGRSTGKSMFLRYWSYQVQRKIAHKREIPLINLLRENKGAGFYFRIDGPKLKSFRGNGLSEDVWTYVFTHYFELVVGRQYVELIKSMEAEGSCKDVEALRDLMGKIGQLIGCRDLSNIMEVASEFDRQLKEVETFLGNVPFYQETFHPAKKGFLSQCLSFGIPSLINTYLKDFQDLNLVILLDEYENFLEDQQKVVNTLLKFSTPHLMFRIGMRLEGFRTFRTISEDDFIKEGREYRKVVFEDILNKDKGYQDFLCEISKKRLESIEVLRDKGCTDIKAMLGERENLEEEAKEIVKDKPDKIIAYFIKKIKREDYEKIKCPDNPLLELLNIVWLMRGIKVETILKSMNDYRQKINDSEDGAKYRRDYVDKYKMSLIFLLCSIYRKNKQYYSFNTFSFLSSGVVGHFIELCRRTFALAHWEDIDSIPGPVVIPMQTQTKAAIELANSEKQQVARIENYGGSISQLVENIGNIFRVFHTDEKLRYPETNQFSINIDSIHDEEIKKSLRSAIRWTIIQRKPNLQRTGPGEGLGDIYTINRIFSPGFQISCRTRGGKSIQISEEEMKHLMVEKEEDPAIYMYSREKKNKDNKKKEQAPGLFS